LLAVKNASAACIAAAKLGYVGSTGVGVGRGPPWANANAARANIKHVVRQSDTKKACIETSPLDGIEGPKDPGGICFGFYNPDHIHTTRPDDFLLDAWLRASPAAPLLCKLADTASQSICAESLLGEVFIYEEIDLYSLNFKRFGTDAGNVDPGRCSARTASGYEFGSGI
jgi:hypothetical protein